MTSAVIKSRVCSLTFFQVQLWGFGILTSHNELLFDRLDKGLIFRSANTFQRQMRKIARRKVSRLRTQDRSSAETDTNESLNKRPLQEGGILGDPWLQKYWVPFTVLLANPEIRLVSGYCDSILSPFQQYKKNNKSYKGIKLNCIFSIKANLSPFLPLLSLLLPGCHHIFVKTYLAFHYCIMFDFC